MVIQKLFKIIEKKKKKKSILISVKTCLFLLQKLMKQFMSLILI